MNCSDTRKLLVFYLDDEVPPGDRRSLEQHLAGCSACREEKAALAAARHSAAQALQSLAAQSEPSPQALSLLQARLARAAQPAPSRPPVWPARPAPGAGRTPTRTLRGDIPMRTRLMIPALIALVAIAVATFLVLQPAAPVSAQQVLDRAYAAQSAAPPGEGIQHIRAEVYVNMQAGRESKGETRTILDGYADLKTGIYRQVTTDAATGRVLEANGYDGTYLYTGWPDEGQAGGQLTIYRAPQSIDQVAELKPGAPAADDRQMFQSMRQEPGVKLLGQETWPDGRTVYVLRWEHPANTSADAGPKRGGSTTMSFDAKTYALVDTRTTVQENGREILLYSYHKLVDEILPPGSPVIWDMSDLQGVAMVDDPTGEHSDLLPVVITREELAARTQSGYLLKNVPEGYTLEISTSPKQSASEPFWYIASYRTAAGDYLVIQAGGGLADGMTDSAGEVYKTAAGLTVYFLDERSEGAPDGKVYTSAIAMAPDGTAFWLNSTLSREQVKALAEELVPIR